MLLKQASALYGPIPVKTETFRELWAPLVHTNFGGNSYGPIIGPFIWTNGPESSSKVSPTLALVHGWLFPVKRRVTEGPCITMLHMLVHLNLFVCLSATQERCRNMQMCSDIQSETQAKTPYTSVSVSEWSLSKLTLPIVHTNITDQKKHLGGIHFGKYYSMITDSNVSRIIFAKITDIIGL